MVPGLSCRTRLYLLLTYLLFVYVQEKKTQDKNNAPGTASEATLMLANIKLFVYFSATLKFAKTTFNSKKNDDINI